MQNIDLLNTLLFATTFLALFFIILYIRQLKNEKNICKKIIDNAKKEVEERLYKDELTGLKNRKSLEDSIKGKDSVVSAFDKQYSLNSSMYIIYKNNFGIIFAVMLYL